MAIVSSGKAARTRSTYVSCTVKDQVYTLYTCPANCVAELSMLLLAGVVGSPDVDVIWNTNMDDGHCHIFGDKNIGVGQYVLLTGATLVLAAGDTLTVKAKVQNNPHLDASCTVIETFIPIG
jgi:hypothetical protein